MGLLSGGLVLLTLSSGFCKAASNLTADQAFQSDAERMTWDKLQTSSYFCFVGFFLNQMNVDTNSF